MSSNNSRHPNAENSLPVSIIPINCVIRTIQTRAMHIVPPSKITTELGAQRPFPVKEVEIIPG